MKEFLLSVESHARSLRHDYGDGYVLLRRHVGVVAARKAATALIVKGDALTVGILDAESKKLVEVIDLD